MKRLVTNRLTWYLEKYNVLTNAQTGICKKKQSCGQSRYHTSHATKVTDLLLQLNSLFFPLPRHNSHSHALHFHSHPIPFEWLILFPFPWESHGTHGIHRFSQFPCTSLHLIYSLPRLSGDMHILRVYNRHGQRRIILCMVCSNSWQYSLTMSYCADVWHSEAWSMCQQSVSEPRQVCSQVVQRHIRHVQVQMQKTVYRQPLWTR